MTTRYRRKAAFSPRLHFIPSEIPSSSGILKHGIFVPVSLALMAFW